MLFVNIENSQECLCNSCVGYNLKIYYIRVKGQVLYLILSCDTIYKIIASTL